MTSTLIMNNNNNSFLLIFQQSIILQTGRYFFEKCWEPERSGEGEKADLEESLQQT